MASKFAGAAEEMTEALIVNPYNVEETADAIRAAIETARAGLYPSGITTDLTPERLRRWFVQEDSHYRVSKDIREMVIFAEIEERRRASDLADRSG